MNVLLNANLIGGKAIGTLGGGEYQRIVTLSLSYLFDREMDTMIFEAVNVVWDFQKPFLLVHCWLLVGLFWKKKKKSNPAAKTWGS